MGDLVDAVIYARLRKLGRSKVISCERNSGWISDRMGDLVDAVIYARLRTEECPWVPAG